SRTIGTGANWSLVRSCFCPKERLTLALAHTIQRARCRTQFRTPKCARAQAQERTLGRRLVKIQPGYAKFLRTFMIRSPSYAVHPFIHPLSVSHPWQLIYQRAELIAAVELVEEHAKAGKSWREKHHVAWCGHRARLLDGGCKVAGGATDDLTPAERRGCRAHTRRDLVGGIAGEHDHALGSRRRLGGVLAHVETLAIAPGDEDQRLGEAAQRSDTRHGGGAGAVVDVGHAVQHADHLQPVGHAAKVCDRPADRRLIYAEQLCGQRRRLDVAAVVRAA